MNISEIVDTVSFAFVGTLHHSWIFKDMKIVKKSAREIVF